MGDTNEIERTTNWVVGFEGEWGLTTNPVTRTLGAKFTGSYGRTTKVTITHQVQVATKRTNTIQRNYPAGPRLAEAGWVRADLFVLSRMDGTEVIRWETVDDRFAPVDRWP